ncbi:MAG: PDZ domain-containing protein [Flavitalea sp.]
MKKISLLLCLALSSVVLTAQKISYIVSFPNIAHHEARISLTASGITQKNAIFRMSRSSPGRYATHEFGKNVYDVKAFDKSNKQIEINRIDADIYEVPAHSGFVRVEYTLFANHPDGTYAGIDASSIHLNAPATFLWMKGADKSPIDVKFNLPKEKNWTISTQLKQSNDSTLFSARDMQYLMDSPINIGELYWKEWKLSNPDGKTYTFRVSLEATTNQEDLNYFAAKIEEITKQSQQVFGEFPSFDYNAYTFITGINPYVQGDGMEHRNSTVINIPVKFSKDFFDDVFAHEFFHCWNIERIRPKTLEPFNFEKSNMSNELWFGEGFTQYYGELLLKRSDFTSFDNYLNSVAGLVNTKENTPGAKRFSPVEVSRNAVFVDAGVAVDKSNYTNMYTSYYPYGASVAMALDLELRTKFQDITLDTYMRAVWKKFGEKEQPYTVTGLENVLADLTKDKSFAGNFFSKYVNGHESFNYAPLLEKAGMKLIQPGAGKAWAGLLQFRAESNLTFAAGTVIGTPFYEAGMDVGDKILQFDGKAVNTGAELRAIIDGHKPGDKVTVQYTHRETTINAELVLSENKRYSVTSFEKENLEVSADIKAFRESWLGDKTK